MTNHLFLIARFSTRPSNEEKRSPRPDHFPMPPPPPSVGGGQFRRRRRNCWFVPQKRKEGFSGREGRENCQLKFKMTMLDQNNP